MQPGTIRETVNNGEYQHLAKLSCQVAKKKKSNNRQVSKLGDTVTENVMPGTKTAADQVLQWLLSTITQNIKRK